MRKRISRSYLVCMYLKHYYDITWNWVMLNFWRLKVHCGLRDRCRLSRTGFWALTWPPPPPKPTILPLVAIGLPIEPIRIVECTVALSCFPLVLLCLHLVFSSAVQWQSRSNEWPFLGVQEVNQNSLKTAVSAGSCFDCLQYSLLQNK